MQKPASSTCTSGAAGPSAGMATYPFNKGRFGLAQLLKVFEAFECDYDAVVKQRIAVHFEGE